MNVDGARAVPETQSHSAERSSHIMRVSSNGSSTASGSPSTTLRLKLDTPTALRAWLHKLNIATPHRGRSVDETVGTSRVDQYELGEVLNQGGFACVRSGCNCVSGESIAAKIMSMSSAVDVTELGWHLTGCF